MDELTKDLLDHLHEDRVNILTSSYPEDTLHEYVDGFVPVYNSALAVALKNDQSLGYPNDFVFGAEVSAFDIIKANLYEKLMQVAREWLSEEQMNDPDSDS